MATRKGREKKGKISLPIAMEKIKEQLNAQINNTALSSDHINISPFTKTKEFFNLDLSYL